MVINDIHFKLNIYTTNKVQKLTDFFISSYYNKYKLMKRGNQMYSIPWQKISTTKNNVIADI